LEQVSSTAMRKIAYIFIFFTCCSTLFAQTGCIDCNQDSLVKRLRMKLSEVDRLYTLMALTDKIVLPPNPDSALHCAEAILKLNDRLKLVNSKPYELIREGLILWKTDEGDSAITRFKEAISAFDQQKKIMGNASLLNTIREFYNYLSAHTDRLKFYEEKLKYYQENGPYENIAVCYHGIAGYYYFKSDYNKAIGYYLKSAENFKRFSYIGYCNEITVVGFLYAKWGNYDRALYWLKLADSLNQKGEPGNLDLDRVEIAKIFKYKHQYEDALYWIRMAQSVKFISQPLSIDRKAIGDAEFAGIYLQMNQPDSAFKYLNLANQSGESNHLFIDGPEGPFEVDYYFFQYYMLKNDLKNAEAHLLVAYVKALKVKSNQLVMKYSKELAGFYNDNHEPQKALLYFQKYIQLNDSLYVSQNSSEIAQYENEQKEQLSLRQIQNMKKTGQSQRRYYLIVAVFLLLVTLGLFSRIQYIRKTKKQLQAQNRIIEKEKLRAEQSEKFKEQFLANMSHEIRTPMNAVMGMANLLIDNNPRNDQYQYLDGIKKSSDILLHIINDILDLSKIEAGKIELERIDFSLNEVVTQVAQILQHKAEEKGLRLCTRIDRKIPDVLTGDPVRLNQILMNLTGNAIKFTEKGSVQIVVKFTNNISPSSFTLHFSVIDTGIGIPEEKLQHIFESFSQANASDTRRFGGTGLGLTISKQLVALMGGEIHVVSKPGSGTTFSFELVLEQGSADKLLQGISSEEEIDGTILNGLKILVVDDNEYNRIVATDTLKSKAKMDIISASDGQEAIDLINQMDFDVILMDVQMPVMDGFEATKYIRENLPSPKNEVPIIALTASVLRSDIDKCRKAGMNS
jgi:signal transduction histidine kinase/CheY-like chemotaxis protein